MSLTTSKIFTLFTFLPTSLPTLLFLNFAAHMAFVDELDENDDSLLEKKYTRPAVVDGQIVVSTNLTLVRAATTMNNTIINANPTSTASGSSATKTSNRHNGNNDSDNMLLYRIALAPKRWRYTGLGSKMNDKQAMTHSPVTLMKHAAQAPKRCLVTLRTTVYQMAERTLDDAMDPTIIRRAAEDAPKYHESEAKVKAKKEELKQKKKKTEELKKRAEKALKLQMAMMQGEKTNNASTNASATAPATASTNTDVTSNSSAVSPKEQNGGKKQELFYPLSYDPDADPKLTHDQNANDGVVYTVLACIRSPAFVSWTWE